MPVKKTSRFVKDVAEFHKKFKLKALKKPGFLDPEYQNFRIKFMQEELDEYKEACLEGNLAKAMDSLVDLVYVAVGTADLQQMPFDESWALVQKANISKKRVKSSIESKRGSSYDVVKPEGWIAPDIAITKLLKKYGA